MKAIRIILLCLQLACGGMVGFSAGVNNKLGIYVFVITWVIIQILLLKIRNLK